MMLKAALSKTFSVGLALLVVVTLGCAEKKEVVSTEMVEGVVTLDGKPVPGATITFTPVQEGTGSAPATGMTDDTGKYTLTAIGVGGGKAAQAGAGALAGDYYVGVVKDEFASVPGSTDPDYKMPSADERPQSPTPTHVVPVKFNNPKTSGIKVSVKAGQNNIPIDLKSS